MRVRVLDQTRVVAGAAVEPFHSGNKSILRPGKGKQKHTIHFRPLELCCPCHYPRSHCGSEGRLITQAPTETFKLTASGYHRSLTPEVLGGQDRALRRALRPGVRVERALGQGLRLLREKKLFRPLGFVGMADYTREAVGLGLRSGQGARPKTIPDRREQLRDSNPGEASGEAAGSVPLRPAEKKRRSGKTLPEETTSVQQPITAEARMRAPTRPGSLNPPSGCPSPRRSAWPFAGGKRSASAPPSAGRSCRIGPSSRTSAPSSSPAALSRRRIHPPRRASPASRPARGRGMVQARQGGGQVPPASGLPKLPMMDCPPRRQTRSGKPT